MERAKDAPPSTSGKVDVSWQTEITINCDFPKIWDSDLGLTGRSRPLEAMLLNAQHADLVIQRRGIEAELRRRTGRSCYTSAALGERLLDHLPLTGRQLVTEKLTSPEMGTSLD